MLFAHADPRGPRCSPTSTCCSLRCSAPLTISCLNGQERPAQPDRRGGRHALRRASDHGITLRRALLAVAAKRLGHLFPRLPKRPGFHKRRARLADTIEALIVVFAERQPRLPRRPGAGRLHPGRVRPRNGQARRPAALADARRRRRLRLLRQPQPLLLGLSPARPVRARRHAQRTGADLAQDARARGLPATCSSGSDRTGPLTVLGDKGYAGADFEAGRRRSAPPSCGPAARTSPATDRTSLRSASGSSRSSGPARTSSPSSATAPAPSAGCGRGSPAGSLALAAAVSLNYELGRPSRALVDYMA